MMLKISILLLCTCLMIEAQVRSKQQQPRDSDNSDRGDDDDGGEEEGTVESKPVVIRLPKNRLSPELHSIASLRKSGEKTPSVVSTAATTDAPTNVLEKPTLEKPTINLPSAPGVLSPNIGPAVPIASGPSVQLRPAVPQRQAALNIPQTAPSGGANSLISNLASGNGLAGLLANNPSLAKLLQGGGLGALAGAPGVGPPGALSPGFGQGGLLTPLQGALPSLGAPPPFPTGTAGGVGGPPGTDNGLLNVISSLGRQLGGAVGLNNIIPGATVNSPPLGPSIPRIAGLNGPPIAGIPNIPGLPVFPGAISPGGQLDVVNLVSAISRRALNGTSVTDVLPPTQIQKLADNLTNVLLPETPEIDLNKYMGRWFEGINSPRATDQRCVVHHYGGLTENGKTATFTALKIYREASEFGQVRYSIGYSFRGGRQEGMMQMHTSEAADPIPYWIYKVGPTGKDPFGNEQYEYAIVSNWIRYPVMVLVRDPDQFKRDHEESVLRWLEEKGFINAFIRAFNLIQPVSYQNCQYADSTFELFG